MKDRKALLLKTILPMLQRIKSSILYDLTDNEKYIKLLGCPMGWK